MPFNSFRPDDPIAKYLLQAALYHPDDIGDQFMCVVEQGMDEDGHYVFQYSRIFDLNQNKGTKYFYYTDNKNAKGEKIGELCCMRPVTGTQLGSMMNLCFAIHTERKKKYPSSSPDIKDIKISLKLDALEFMNMINLKAVVNYLKEDTRNLNAVGSVACVSLMLPQEVNQNVANEVYSILKHATPNLESIIVNNMTYNIHPQASAAPAAPAPVASEKSILPAPIVSQPPPPATPAPTPVASKKSILPAPTVSQPPPTTVAPNNKREEEEDDDTICLPKNLSTDSAKPEVPEQTTSKSNLKPTAEPWAPGTIWSASAATNNHDLGVLRDANKGSKVDPTQINRKR